MRSNQIRKFLLRVLLGPAMMFGILGVDGGEGGEGGTGGGEQPAGGTEGGAAPTDGGAEGGAAATPTEAEAAAAAEAETARRAALTQEQRDTEDAAADAAKKAAEGEITYTDFKMPDGETLDQSMVDAALPIFKELKLTQEQAQQLVDLQAANVKAANEAFAADKTSRLDAIKNGKEFGGDKFEASAEAVGRALNTVLTQDEQVALKAYTDRFGPCPEIFTMMARVATRMKEDTSFETGGQQETRTVNFYNKSNMK